MLVVLHQCDEQAVAYYCFHSRPTITQQLTTAQIKDMPVKQRTDAYHRGDYDKMLSTREIRRGGLTPAISSAHAGNGRGCRKIDPISATVLPRGNRSNFIGWVRLSRERAKRPYTSTPWASVSLAESTMELGIHTASHDAEQHHTVCHLT